MPIIEIILSILLIIAITIIAIRVDFKFDLNQWLESRQNKRQVKLKNICPHAFFYKGADGNYYIESLFYSPHGTTSWYCRQCNIFSPIAMSKDHMDYWKKNIKELNDRQKKFRKEAKKMGLAP